MNGCSISRKRFGVCLQELCWPFALAWCGVKAWNIYDVVGDDGRRRDQLSESPFSFFLSSSTPYGFIAVALPAFTMSFTTLILSLAIFWSLVHLAHYYLSRRSRKDSALPLTLGLTNVTNRARRSGSGGDGPRLRPLSLVASTSPTRIGGVAASSSSRARRSSTDGWSNWSVSLKGVMLRVSTTGWNEVHDRFAARVLRGRRSLSAPRDLAIASRSGWREAGEGTREGRMGWILGVVYDIGIGVGVLGMLGACGGLVWVVSRLLGVWLQAEGSVVDRRVQRLWKRGVASVKHARRAPVDVGESEKVAEHGRWGLTLIVRPYIINENAFVDCHLDSRRYSSTLAPPIHRPLRVRIASRARIGACSLCCSVR